MHKMEKILKIKFFSLFFTVKKLVKSFEAMVFTLIKMSTYDCFEAMVFTLIKMSTYDCINYHALMPCILINV